MSEQIPVTAIIPTADRSEILKSTLESIAKQHVQPRKIIIVDASADNKTKEVCNSDFDGLKANIIYQQAVQKGAAIQRNQAMNLVSDPVIFFCDDDIKLEPFCIERLWNCLQSDEKTGGVNAMIINQQYHKPGKATAMMYRLMHGSTLLTYAGKCIGPGWNLLPEDKEGSPDCNETEWLNTTCTFYKRTALPNPVFPTHFTGYSMMEDVALSLTVGKQWKLFNARTARIFHDSQPGAHKRSVFLLSKMELVNRGFIMTKILGRTGFRNYLKLFVFEIWGIFSSLNNGSGWKNLIPNLLGKFAAIPVLLRKK